MSDFLANWKTTLAGIVGATANIVVAYLQGTLDTKTFVISFFMAAFGVLAKDATKTGTASNPRAEYQGDPAPASLVPKP